MGRRSRLTIRILGGVGLAAGLMAMGAFGGSATSLTASATAATYSPVAFNLASLINGGVLSPSVHLEQTVQAANGNYYVNTDGGNGITSTNEIIDVSGIAPHAAIGVIQLPSALNGQALGDGVAIGNTLYYRNVTGKNPIGGTNVCPVIAVDLSNLGSPTTSATSPAYSIWMPTSATGLSCPPEPSSSSSFSASESYPIAMYNDVIYWTSKSSLFAWNPSSGSVTRVVSGFSTGGGLSVNSIGGLIYAFVGSTGNSIGMYNLGANGVTSAPNASYTWTLPASVSGGLGDFQLSQNGSQLWFVREFHTQIGYVKLPSDLTSSISGSGTGQLYNVTNVPNGGSQAESMTLDPLTGNLWVASGNVNGQSSFGGQVDFGWFNPSSFSGSGTSGGTSVGSVALNYESTPPFLSLGADDFALVGSNPAYFSLGPILSITKTDNVNHVTTSGAPFDWTITAGVSSQSSYPEPSQGVVAEGTLKASADTNGSLGSGFPIMVTDPLPAGVTPTSVASGTGWSCVQSGSSSTGYVETCTYSLGLGNNQQTISVGGTLPPITVPVVGVGVPGTQFDNTATVSSPNATPQSAYDTVTVVAPTTAPTTLTPGLSLTKTEAPSSPNPITKAGQSVTYDFAVTNTGNTTLYNLAITDAQSVPGETLNAPISCPATSLAAGASVTCTGSYTVTSTDITNAKVADTAVATATTSTGTSVTSNHSTLTIPVSVPTTSSKTVTPKTTTKTVTPITKSSSTAPTPVKLVTGPPAPPASSTNALPLGAGIAGLGIAGLGYLVIERKRNNQHGSTDEVA